MKKKKIIHFVEEFDIGGMEKCAHSIMCGLYNNYDFELWCIRKKGRLLKQLPDDIPVREVSNLICLIKSIYKYSPDIIHSHGYGAGIMGRFAALISSIFFRKHKLKTILHVQSTLYQLNRWNKLKEKLLSYKTDAIIAVSDAVKKCLVEFVGIKSKNIFLIYNPSPEFKNISPYDKALLKEELNINLNNYIIGYWGRLIQLKGIEYLIKSSTQLNRADVTYLIIGDGDNMDRLKNICNSLNINNVVFTGMRNDIDRLSSIVDIYVQPSITREGLPLSLIESAARGIPLIATDIGGNSEIVVNNINGFIVPIKDEKSIGDKISYLLNNPEIRLKMGTASKDIFIKKGMSLNNMLVKIDELYKNI